MCSRRRAVNVFHLCIDSGDESGACMCDGSLVALFVSGGSFTRSQLCVNAMATNTTVKSMVKERIVLGDMKLALGWRAKAIGRCSPRSRGME